MMIRNLDFRVLLINDDKPLWFEMLLVPQAFFVIKNAPCMDGGC